MRALLRAAAVWLASVMGLLVLLVAWFLICVAAGEFWNQAGRLVHGRLAESAWWDLALATSVFIFGTAGVCWCFLALCRAAGYSDKPEPRLNAAGLECDA